MASKDQLQTLFNLQMKTDSLGMALKTVLINKTPFMFVY